MDHEDRARIPLFTWWQYTKIVAKIRSCGSLALQTQINWKQMLHKKLIASVFWNTLNILVFLLCIEHIGWEIFLINKQNLSWEFPEELATCINKWSYWQMNRISLPKILLGSVTWLYVSEYLLVFFLQNFVNCGCQ